MNRFKNMVTILLIMCLAFSLCACSGSKGEYESIRKFEFIFFPEEYEEEYSKVSKTLSLEADADYQLIIDASCENGTMEICIKYADENEKEYSIDPDMPCYEELSVLTGTASEISVTVSIEPDTQGKVIAELLVN